MADMNIIGRTTSTLRYIRRKWVADTSPMLPVVRRLYRWLFAHASKWKRGGIPTRISTYGTFRIAPELIFGTYNFEEWGSGSNDGFHAWMKLSSGKRVVLDIGAHVGLYALPAARVLASGGQLYAFEPGDDNQAFLRRHIAMNAMENVEVVPYLVGDEKRNNVPFFSHATDGAMHSIVQRFPGKCAVTHKQQIRLDDFCAERGIVPEVIKIDVEGAELKVLLGAQQTLLMNSPTIILSVHPKHLLAMGSSADALREQIDAFGYDVRDMQGNNPDKFTLAEYVLTPKYS